jgi:hypothetical protein
VLKALCSEPCGHNLGALSAAPTYDLREGLKRRLNRLDPPPSEDLASAWMEFSSASSSTTHVPHSNVQSNLRAHGADPPTRSITRQIFAEGVCQSLGRRNQTSNRRAYRAAGDQDPIFTVLSGDLAL